MIIKGVSCAGAGRLATHLTRTDTNERAEVREVKGVAADDLRGALKEMEAVAAGARTTKPFYHASINTRADERLTDEQRKIAIDRLEEALGLTGQPRVVVVHEKEGREHCHIVWSRIDINRMAAISDSHNYRKHEQVARELEREFGHQRVQGAHVEREGKERPDRTPSHSEMLQGDRTGIGAKEAKEFMTGIWQTTKTGGEFKTALEKEGWTLARGDRRDFVAIDPMGGIHSVARRIEGARVADIKMRFADIDPRQLPSVIQTKQLLRGQDHQTALRTRLASRARLAQHRSSSEIKPRGWRPTRLGGAAKTAGGLASSLFSAFMGETPAPRPKPTMTPQQAAEADSEAQRRQELRSRMSREITPETQRDAEIEQSRRDRDRTRG